MTHSGEMLEEFLQGHYYNKNKGLPLTHTAMPSGSYTILDKDYDKFLTLLKNYIDDGYEVGLVERHNGKEVGPFITDFDFKSKNRNRTYTKDDIEKTIFYMNKSIKRLFNVSNEHLFAYVFEKDGPTKEIKKDDIKYKDGFHIFYPYLPLKVEYRYYLYSTILKELETTGVLSSIPSLEPLSEVFDYRVIYNNGIMMYGNNKPGRTPYELTRVYNHKLEEIDTDDLTIQDKLLLSSVRYFDNESSLELINTDDEEKCIEVCKKYNYKQDKQDKKDNKKDNKVESVDVKHIDEQINKLKEEKKTLKEEEKKKAKDEENEPDEIIETTQKELYELILKNLKDSRYKNYEQWYKMGIVSMNAGEEIYEIFDKYSEIKAPEKYDKVDNYKIISNLCKKEVENPVTEKTLLKWLKEDNEEIYKLIKANNIRFDCVTSKDYCNILVDLLNDYLLVEEIITTTGGVVQHYYNWNGIYWKLCSIDTFLDNYIPDKLYKYFVTLINKKSLVSKYVKSNYSTVIKKVKITLQTQKHFKDIKIMFKSAMAKTDIEWNKNPYLFVFNNCVYDLEKSKFVEPCKEDYINHTCGYDYDEKNNYDKHIKIIEDFYKDILDEEARDTLLTYQASSLKRYNTDQQALFAVGKGGNGKGMNVMLLQKALGNYIKELEMTYFTTVEKHADTPNTSLAECRNARLITVAEAEENTNEQGKQISIVKSKFKKTIGQDEIQVRPTFEKILYRFKMGTIIFSTNNIPNLDAVTDYSMKRRILIVSFKYTFVDNPDPENKYEKKKNTKLADYFETAEAQQAYIRILFKYYKKYKTSGLVINDEVKKNTESILNNQSHIYRCVNKMLKNNILVKTNNDDDKILIKDIYENYYRDREFGEYEFITSNKFTKDIKSIYKDFIMRETSHKLYLIGYNLDLNAKWNDTEEEN